MARKGSLEDQVALVTGGASGLGAPFVDRFIAEGARVAVLDRLTPSGLKALENPNTPGLTLGLLGDVRSPCGQQGSCGTVLRYTLAVSNAARSGKRGRGCGTIPPPSLDLPEDRIDAAFDENFSRSTSRVTYCWPRRPLRPSSAVKGR